MFRSENRALSVGPCSPTRLWKTRDVYENWTHLSRSDLRNHAWVTRGTSVSWESSLHQPLFLSIKSDVLKFKCQNPLLVNVSTPLLKLLLMESEVVWWQTAEPQRRTWHVSELWIPLSRQKGCGGPFWPDKMDYDDLTSLSTLFQALLVFVP